MKEEGDDMTDKILLVEDEEKLARMVELELKYEGYQVDKAADGRTGLDMAQTGDYDLILLDIMLPALNGMEVLRRLRRESLVPVIMLTARDTVMDKVSPSPSPLRSCWPVSGPPCETRPRGPLRCPVRWASSWPDR